MAEGASLKVLLATNKGMLVQHVRPVLESAGLLVRVSPTIEALYDSTELWDPDIFVLDMEALASDESLDSLRFARRNRPDALIVALTRNHDLDAKLTALSRGADDVLPIPFAPAELLARIEAMARRIYREYRPINPMLKAGALEIDLSHHQARAWGRQIRMTSTELRLLYLLASNESTILSRDDILDNIWGRDFAADSNLVDRHVSNLRTKLEVEGHLPRCIFTIRGRGYSFIPPVAEPQQPRLVPLDTCG
jgi:two-component system alkaline phosphatase synthesis response regulator PhoP